MLTEIVRHPALVAEALLLLGAIWLSVYRPAIGRRAFSGIEGVIRTIGHRPALSIVSVALLVVASRLLLLIWIPFPDVVGRDESSLMLQAETFLRGRWANPVHPHSAFFESVYVHQWPTYGSMYFPGKSIEILLGLALFETPGAGALAVMAILSGTMVWALRGWLSPPLAYVGGLIFVVKFGLSVSGSMDC